MRLAIFAFSALMIGLLAACGTTERPEVKPDAAKGSAFFEEQYLLTAGEGGYFRFRIPSLVVSTKGTVLAMAEARMAPGSDDAEIDLVMKRSTDNGKTWSAPQVIAGEGSKDTWNQPCPVVDRQTGAIVLAFCKNNQQFFVTKSTDEGLTWSQPVEITSDVKDPSWSYVGAGPGHGIQLKSGRLLIPSWGDTSPGPVTWRPPNWGKIQFSYVFYSDDHGSTWKRTAPLTMDLSDECEVVETADGSVYMNARSRQKKNKRAYAWSKDGGVTWSEVKFDDTLPEPSCQGSVVRFTGAVSSGKNRVLLSHPYDSTYRSHMTVRVSYDECQTWPVSKIVNRGASGYSDLAVASDMTILLLYESDGLRLARFSLEWLTDGSDRLR